MTPLQEKVKEEIDKALGREDWTLREALSKTSYDKKLMLGTYQLMVGRVEAARWSLTPMPGCCGICVSTGAIVQTPFRQRGLGRVLNELRKDIAREQGYTVLLCTDVLANEPQQKILKQNGWREVYRFVNDRTKNPVSMHVVGLR